MKTCEEFADGVTEYLEGRLPFSEKMGMWVHRAMCSSCRAYLRQIELVRQASSKLRPDEEPDEDQVDELAKIFRDGRS